MHERPEAKPELAAFDQASQKPVFPAGTDRGTPEAFLAWAMGREHPADGERAPLDVGLEAAVTYVWRRGSSVVADRRERVRVVGRIANSLEPLTREMATTMCDNAKRVAKAMALNVMRRTQPSATVSWTTWVAKWSLRTLRCGVLCVTPCSGPMIGSLLTCCGVRRQ